MLADFAVAIFVCPKTKGPLVYFPRGERDRDEAEAFLFQPTARLRYRIIDGIPNLLADEAELVSPDEADRLIKRARELGLPNAA